MVAEDLDQAAFDALQAEGPNERRASMSEGSNDVPFDSADPMFSSDEFRMYEMKIRRCPRARPHDWTLCPFAHPGEKAKRRDPRKFAYSGTACAEYRKSGQCVRGDACTFSHGVFECHLHPARYRTQLCTDGLGCRRRVCFFAHQESELRCAPEGTGSPPSLSGETSAASGLDSAAAAASLLQGQASLAQALRTLIDVQARVRQEEAVTAAAQALDPMAKLRLLRALQGETGLGPLGTPSGSVDAAVDPALLAALSQLTVGGGTPARHSLDGGYPGVPLAGAFGSLGPMDVPPVARRSIDIGSLSRVGADPLASISAASRLSTFAGSDLAGSVPAPGPAPVSLPPSSLYSASLPSPSFMDFAAAAGLGGSLGGRRAGSPGTHSPPGGDTSGPGSSSSHSDSGAAGGIGERAGSVGVGGLQSIDEHFATGEDEATSCSTASVVGRSASSGSSLDKEAVSGGAGSPRAGGIGGAIPGAMATAGSMKHAMSFDNILAELPRSASQVNMVGLGLGQT